MNAASRGPDPGFLRGNARPGDAAGRSGHRPQHEPDLHGVGPSSQGPFPRPPQTGRRPCSIVVPTLNEAAHLEAALRSARAGCPHELIVVDGGSTDGTVSVAKAAGAVVIAAAPGRARQMNLGAARATGAVLLFLHADTVLPEAWPAVVEETLAGPGVVAGAFGFRLAEEFAGRWLVQWTTNLRSRWLQQPYGDQALFLPRAVFQRLGGFADLPIMEDYEFVRRLRHLGRVVTARTTAVTSGRRWKQLGWVRTTLLNKLMIAGYRLGISPRRLERIYRRASARTRGAAEAPAEAGQVTLRATG